jgi:hypothetical protein
MPLNDDQALSEYIRAAEAEAKAQICSHYATDFAAEFERRYQAWRQANSEALARGAVLAEARGMNGNAPPSVKAFARMGAQLLNELPEDDRQRRCNELLAFFTQSEAK